MLRRRRGSRSHAYEVHANCECLEGTWPSGMSWCRRRQRVRGGGRRSRAGARARCRGRRRRLLSADAQGITGQAIDLDPDALVWRRDPGRNPGGVLYDDGVHKYATAAYWIGEIGDVSAIVSRGPDFIQEAPSLATSRFKDRACVGIVD